MAFSPGLAALGDSSKAGKGNDGLAATDIHDAAQQRRSFWQGESGGFHVQFNSHDLIARQGSAAPVAIFSALATDGYQRFSAGITEPGSDDVPDCAYERSFRLLAVAGPLLGFSDEYYSDCGGAHPAQAKRLTTVDLRRVGPFEYFGSDASDPLLTKGQRSGTLVLLTDYFPESEILAALISDRLVKKALDGHPRTLGELLSMMKDTLMRVGSCDFAFPKDALSRFVFHHVESGGVAVRVSLIPDSIACQTRTANLGLVLKIPPELADWLRAADARSTGFLMKDADRLAGVSPSKLAFPTAAAGKH